jgi:hypothetical protein
MACRVTFFLDPSNEFACLIHEHDQRFSDKEIRIEWKSFLIDVYWAVKQKLRVKSKIKPENLNNRFSKRWFLACTWAS